MSPDGGAGDGLVYFNGRRKINLITWKEARLRWQKLNSAPGKASTWGMTELVDIPGATQGQFWMRCTESLKPITLKNPSQFFLRKQAAKDKKKDKSRNNVASAFSCQAPAVLYERQPFPDIHGTQALLCPNSRVPRLYSGFNCLAQDCRKLCVTLLQPTATFRVYCTTICGSRKPGNVFQNAGERHSACTSIFD